MAILLRFESPARRADVEAITESMGIRVNPPKGLICHVATDTPSGVQVYDVWESLEDFELFTRDQILPATRTYLAERNLPTDIPMPELTVVEAYDLVLGR
jgi:hypothetical protein